MGTINTIGIGMSVDTNPLVQGVARGNKALDDFSQSAQRTQRVAEGLDLTPRTSAAGDASGGGSGGAAAAEQAQQQAAQMRAAFASGLAPLGQFAARFESQFQVVGGTIVTLARRIDSAMKFPQTDAALTRLQAKIRSEVAKGTADAQGSVNRLQAAIVRLGPAADKAVGAFRGFLKVRNILSDFGDVAGRPLKALGNFNLAPQVAQAQGLSTGFGRVAPAVGVATGAVKRLGVEIALALGFFGLAFKGVQFLKSGITEASNLNESLNKTGVIFRDQAGIVTQAADEMARKYGTVKTSFVDASAGIGQLLQGMGGQTDKASAETSVKLAKLAADAGSIFNVGFDEATSKIESALRGQSEPISAFGIDVQEAATKQEALRLGLIKGSQELTTAQKVTARTSLIIQGLAVAEGDLANTIDAPANAFRRFQGNLTNTAGAIGTALLPAIQKGIGLLNEFASWVGAAFERNKGVFDGFTAGLGSAIDLAGAILRNLPIAWEIVKLQFFEGSANILSYVETIPANLGIIGEWIANNWSGLVIDGINVVAIAFENLGANIGKLWTATQDFLAGKGFHVDFTPILADFTAVTAKLPELVKPGLISFQREIDEQLGLLKKNEADRAAKSQGAVAAAGARANRPKPITQEDLAKQKKSAKDAKTIFEETRTPIEKYSKKLKDLNELFASKSIDAETFNRSELQARKELQGEHRTAGALQAGSTEAYSAQLRFLNQGQGDEPIKEVAKQSTTQTELQKQMAIALNKLAGGTGRPTAELFAL